MVARGLTTALSSWCKLFSMVMNDICNNNCDLLHFPFSPQPVIISHTRRCYGEAAFTGEGCAVYATIPSVSADMPLRLASLADM